MRVLYLNYGPQSGVTESIATRLSAAGLEVLQVNPTEGFLWQHRPGSKLPNLRPVALRAFLEAAWSHRARWKVYWLHTVYAFDRLSDLAGEAVRTARPDAVLQSGVLFGPGRFPEVPYHLYVDHTRAIAERYEPAPGLPPPVPYHPGWRAREQAVYRGAARIFTMSDFVKGSLVADYGVEPGRVHVVGAGPNVQPRPGDLAAPREKAILFVGRRFVPKGGPTLLDAFALVRRDHPDARLWIVSSSAPARLPEGATFHGVLGPAGLRQLYARASVFALPTLREAFGIALVEAMTFGLPVVASRVEAIPEIVSHGETGLLVPPSEPVALARALGELLGDPVRARLLGAAGHARATTRFGWDLAASRMIAVLRPLRAAPEPPAVEAAAELRGA
ncbi:MAG TPA: glycosyltransferase family 4 protein [Anaeromyxobacter sp.]|nr:glycosyltransferase family 4 protein [Anaeromyxobacter sp.]